MLTYLQNLELNAKLYWKICVIFFIAFFIQINASGLSPNIQSAAATSSTVVVADDPITAVLCKVTGALTGKLGKSIATIGIVALGVGLFLGKLSWGLAVATAVGVALIFGAGTFITWINSTATATCT